MTSLSRGPGGPSQTPFLYQGRVENLKLDGQLEDVFCQRLDRLDSADTGSIIRDANSLKGLFLSPEVAAARAEADQHSSADVTVDLGRGPEEFHVTKMPSGDHRLTSSNDPGWDVNAQVILMQGGEHGHYAILSTNLPGQRRDEPDLLQTIKMSFTKGQNFVVDTEELHVGRSTQDSRAPHVPAWDHNPLFQHVKPFR